MKITDFCRDRAVPYMVYAVIFVLIVLFMRAFRVPYQLIVIIGVIFWLGIIGSEVWEISRRKKFYDDMLNKLDSLERKYLISEMLDEPLFLDGRIFWDVLCQADKSMCENAAEYRRNSASFREFIEMWVHEVKLPLSSLLLMMHNNKSEANGKVLEQLRRIDGYTDTVLYYARSETAEKDHIIKEITLRRTVTGVAVKYRDDLLLHNVQLQTDSLDISVLTDGKWLEFILGQLLANSLKYFSADREAEIRISAEDLPDKTILRFRDNGIGIPENDIPYIFEKSFTGENGRTHARSTGMGLYIVKNLCTRLGHKISVNSVKGEFTEFEITFTKNDFYKAEP